MDYNVQIAMTINSIPDDPAAVARLVGVRAARIAYKGQRDPVRVVPRANFVSYYSDASSWDAGLEEHWTSFHEKFRGKEDILAEISARAEIKITIIVDHKGRFPSIFLTHEMLRFAFQSGAAIDIDVYEEDIED